MSGIPNTSPAAPEPPFGTVEQALDDLQRGEFVILADSDATHSEGDLVIAAEKCTPEAVTVMASETAGIVFLSLSAERVEQLGLRRMAPHSDTQSWKAAMTVSVEARLGVTTGISAHDRAHTVRVAIDPRTQPSDLVSPGHVFPVAADPAGVLGRLGRTEALVDLARLAGLTPAGVAAEIVTADGAAAHLAELVSFARTHGLRIVTVVDILRHRWRTEHVLRREGQAVLRTNAGDFSGIAFRDLSSGVRHLALVRGVIDGRGEIAVSVHGECFIGDVLGATECKCASSLQQTLARLGSFSRSVLIYVGATTQNALVCGRRNPEREAAVASQVLWALGIDVDEELGPMTAGDGNVVKIGFLGPAPEQVSH